MKNYYKELVKLLENSYSPYSNFKVASVVIDKDGNKHHGVNVESATFGATICAERNAIFSAMTSGIKKGEIKEVHLMAKNNDGYIEVTPCGICRQIIFEFGGKEVKVITYSGEDNFKEFDYKTLYPNGFFGDEIK